MPSASYTYFDHNATTPLDPRVREVMVPWLGERWGNPSSIHRVGQEARDAVETARAQVARLLGARTLEVIFTASGTEANNAVLQGVARKARHRGRIVLSAFEHPSVEATAGRLAEDGMEVVRVAPDGDGVVHAERVLEAVGEDGATRLVCLMRANNELGTLQPVAEVAAACRERGVPVLCDAVQAVGKIPVDVTDLGVDALVLGGHKFYGPLGAAALWLRPGFELDPFLLGGGQERRRRSSTENIPAIVGLGEAARLTREELDPRQAHLAALRERFEAGLAERLPGAVIHAAGVPRLPQTSHVAFPGVEGESLLIRLDLAGFAVSTGSACSSGAVEPSRTLKAVGMDPREALSSLRISFGAPNTLAEVDRFLEVLAREVTALEALSGVAPAARASA